MAAGIDVGHLQPPKILVSFGFDFLLYFLSSSFPLSPVLPFSLVTRFVSSQQVSSKSLVILRARGSPKILFIRSSQRHHFGGAEPRHFRVAIDHYRSTNDGKITYGLVELVGCDLGAWVQYGYLTEHDAGYRPGRNVWNSTGTKIKAATFDSLIAHLGTIRCDVIARLNSFYCRLCSPVLIQLCCSPPTFSNVSQFQPAPFCAPLSPKLL